MENGLAIAIIVGFVVVYILWNKLLNAGTKKLNQKVISPKSYKQGMQITKETHVFKVNAAPKQVRAAVLNGVTASDSVPAVKPGLHRSQDGDRTLVFDYGSKLQGVFRMVVSFDGGADSTSGVFTFTNWMETEGVVARQKEMKKLNEDVEAALRRLDPGASISVQAS